MGTQYLIDTSAAIKFLNETLPQKGSEFMHFAIQSGPVVSFVTEIELLSWSSPDPNDMNIYLEFIAGSSVIGITQAIITQAIHLRKTYKLKIADALIAATALELNYTLVGDNDKDFSKVPALAYVNPRLL